MHDTLKNLTSLRLLPANLTRWQRDVLTLVVFILVRHVYVAIRLNREFTLESILDNTCYGLITGLIYIVSMRAIGRVIRARRERDREKLGPHETINRDP